MGVLPGSHRGELFDLYGDDGRWAGAMQEADVNRVDLAPVVWLSGPAGSVTVHNCCMVHGSQPNRSIRPRPLLLQTYSAVSSYPVAGIGANNAIGPSAGTVIGGEARQMLDIDGRTMRGAPNWARSGAPTIFGSQQDAAGAG
jgi:ectoine hydroxylase